MIITYLANNWKYSNAPEGQQPFEKVIGLSKYGLGTGLVVGIYDSILMSQAYGFWEAVNCISYWVIPATCMCATFASVAYTVTKLRGKDGYTNYALASLATGGVFYHWQKRGPLSYYFTIILLGLSMIKKHGDINGWNPLPLNPEVTTQHTSFPFDFTITKDPRGRRPWE